MPRGAPCSIVYLGHDLGVQRRDWVNQLAVSGTESIIWPLNRIHGYYRGTGTLEERKGVEMKRILPDCKSVTVNILYTWDQRLEGD